MVKRSLDEQEILHSTPKNIAQIIATDQSLNEKWHSLTPLARNEWICWVTSPKKSETRASHLQRMSIDLLAGKRRPCCWPGCPHRKRK